MLFKHERGTKTNLPGYRSLTGSKHIYTEDYSRTYSLFRIAAIAKATATIIGRCPTAVFILLRVCVVWLTDKDQM